MKPMITTVLGGGATLCWFVIASCIFAAVLGQGGTDDYDDDDDDDPFKNMTKCSGGYCVEIHLCKNDTIVSEGVGLIEERMSDADYDDIMTISTKKDDNIDECEGFLLKCCSPPNAPRNINLPKITPPPVTPAPMTCGQGHPKGYFYRVINDDSAAQYGEFPWTAALFRAEVTSNDPKYFCGGSLIHPQAVLTAAHCLRNFSDPYGLTVRLGEWDIINTREPIKHKDFTVRRIVKHEGYHIQKYHNDLALLILDKPASLGPTINTVCLPDAGESFNGKRCVAVGWGKTAQNGAYSEVLKKVELPVVGHRACQRMLRQTALGPIFQLNTGFLCAGGEAGVDTCQGDGGAPLMCDRGDGSYVQAGIVAWGIGCGVKDVPGVYVQVAKFTEWIEDQLNLEGLT